MKRKLSWAPGEQILLCGRLMGGGQAKGVLVLDYNYRIQGIRNLETTSWM